ncbi:MAG: hypothetical protein LBH96_02545 [Candidatus Peribacteria bacterium]|nr:hypothetical protein [Candidatus Peribacteria bacterium]
MSDFNQLFCQFSQKNSEPSPPINSLTSFEIALLKLISFYQDKELSTWISQVE